LTESTVEAPEDKPSNLYIGAGDSTRRSGDDKTLKTGCIGIISSMQLCGISIGFHSLDSSVLIGSTSKAHRSIRIDCGESYSCINSSSRKDRQALQDRSHWRHMLFQTTLWNSIEFYDRSSKAHSSTKSTAEDPEDKPSPAHMLEPVTRSLVEVVPL